jgi:23S rRNA (cytosine1962-C5)-methyltransferase
MSTATPKVNLHPASCKYLKLGHPWITEDSYTKKFPTSSQLLLGVDEKSKKEIALLIQDPNHKTVKARLWSLNPEDFKPDFNLHHSLEMRVSTAVKKRVELFTERENLFLINGESDQLPGLLVQLLKNEIIVQYYALFWQNLESVMIKALRSALKEYFPALEIKDVWIQERNFDQQKVLRSLENQTSSEFTLTEFGRQYRIRINQHYDFGIYSDMSAIRKAMKPYLTDKKSLLNLFSYTGAFSVFALGLGFNDVVSVDLSPKYLAWLEENISLNSELNKEQNLNLCMPCEKALDKLIADKKIFEVIVCDPPSASSDGQKMSSALKSYEMLLPKMLKLLDSNGSMFVFLNTHAVSWNKFEEKLKQIIETTPQNNKVIVGKRFKLSEDCLPLKGFHEGDYLKGFLVEFKNKGKE